MASNCFNLRVWGLPLEHFLHDIDASNRVEEKPVYYWVNQKNMTVPLDAGYVALVNSTDIIVKDLNVSNNYQGVLVSYSDSITVQDILSSNNYYGIHMVASNNSIIIQNNLRNNVVGLLLDLSSCNYVSENNLLDNTQGVMLSYSSLFTPRSIENCIYKNKIVHNGDGILISGASNNSFCGNDIINNNRYGVLAISLSDYNVFCGNNFLTNAKGIGFQSSSNNIVYNNNFINNTLQVDMVDASANYWNLSRYTGGNYWSNNSLIDVDTDGIIDLPYQINNFNIDHHPLAGAFSNHSVLWQSEEYYIAAISNSTERIFEFLPQEKKISFTFIGLNHSLGFCRLSIQKKFLSSFWQDNFTISINGEDPLNISMWEYDGFIYVYFTYLHPNSQVQLIPEFLYNVCLAFFIVISTVTSAIAKKTNLI
jgi:parallel beta-helix repeat protein